MNWNNMQVEELEAEFERLRKDASRLTKIAARHITHAECREAEKQWQAEAERLRAERDEAREATRRLLQPFQSSTQRLLFIESLSWLEDE